MAIDMKFAPIIFLLLAAVEAHADSAWETHIEGTGTPFEKRWASTEPLLDESSAGTMLGMVSISADEGDLDLYVVHPYPIVEAFISALAGEELECSFDRWRVAVDSEEFKVAETFESTDNSGTFLQPHHTEAFWEAFVTGSLLAVQVERTCDGDMDVATLVYSLSGSQAAKNFLLNKGPRLPEKEAQQIGEVQPDGDVIRGTAENDYSPIVRVAPIYPRSALSRGLEGHVDISFTITTSGTVRDPVVVQSTDPLFDRAAIGAVLKYKYKPRIVDGIPLEVPAVETRVLFKLEE